MLLRGVAIRRPAMAIALGVLPRSFWKTENDAYTNQPAYHKRDAEVAHERVLQRIRDGEDATERALDARLGPLPPPVDAFVPPPGAMPLADAAAASAAVHSEEGVLEGTTWVCAGNRWYRSLAELGKPYGRVSEYERRGRDKTRALRRLADELGLAIEHPDMTAVLRDLPFEVKYPATPNWREAPAIAVRRAERKRLSELRKRCKRLWQLIAEERAAREAAERVEMDRQHAIRRSIHLERRRRVQLYQNAWNDYRRRLRERYDAQFEIVRAEKDRVRHQSKLDWLESLNRVLAEFKDRDVPNISTVLRNYRYLTHGGKDWFTGKN